ncbi:TetR/AcrR family transcriptional regulator [Microlunatus elymi]|uniref:TetR/AcrR family transcriptional regulator n=1 Tax=Microlunatus elymi TaxID=2596828 RepID=A0A516PUK8_9ACTN|nr:TetR/AcrR family transcriptional regulator [Microlunatus elymi]QDP94842.1 TetR/AcrR family transcriptional regulator [Microlunatus elymi]
MSDASDLGLPRAVAIAWGMVADPQRGPKRELSHERIVEAAIELADAEGIGAVTMSKVASSLGFTTMALYRYVTAKDDLLQLMQDAVLEQLLGTADPELQPQREDQVGSGWERELRLIADQLYAMYREHPWMIEIPVASAQLLMPNNLALVDSAMRAMRQLPIADHEKIGALLLISTFVRGAADLVRDIGGRIDPVIGGAPGSRAQLIKELISEERYPYLRPLVESGIYTAGVDAPVDDDPSDYDFGIQLILAGIANHAADPSQQMGAATSEPGFKSDDQLAEALTVDHVRKDPKVKDAVRRRREAETKLREARKRERDQIKSALERGPKS